MGWFGGKSSGDCEDSGGHDQRGPHVRTDESTGKQKDVVDCKDCGKEWTYDK